MAKANVLSRAMEFLVKLVEEPTIKAPIDHKKIERSLRRIKADVATDYELIRDTIDMVFNILCALCVSDIYIDTQQYLN